MSLLLYYGCGTPIETRHLDLYSGYCAEFKPEHAPLVTKKMIKETTLTGSAEELQVRIRKMTAAGGNQVTIAGDRTGMEGFNSHVIQPPPEGCAGWHYNSFPPAPI